MMEAIHRWGADAEGSTRPMALLRICLALIVWTKFARHMRFIDATSMVEVAATILFFSSTVMMFAGFRARLACAVVAGQLFTGYLWLGHMAPNPSSWWATHHMFILIAAVALLALTPCGRSYSVDRWLDIRRADAAGTPPPAEHGPLWGQRLIVLQMAALYFWTAVDKTGWHFLSGARLESIMIWGYEGGPLGPFLTLPALATVLAITVTVIEYVLPIGIVWKRLHWIAVPTGIALHAAFYTLLPVNTYSITMIALYLAVVDPDTVHRVLDRMQGHTVTGTTDTVRR